MSYSHCFYNDFWNQLFFGLKNSPDKDKKKLLSVDVFNREFYFGGNSSSIRLDLEENKRNCKFRRRITRYLMVQVRCSLLSRTKCCRGISFLTYKKTFLGLKSVRLKQICWVCLADNFTKNVFKIIYIFYEISYCFYEIR